MRSAAAALVVAAPSAMAAPEPCVTTYDPQHPGYAAPTCPNTLVKDW